MNITRQNYEEYFLLYVDNELSIADRKAVDAFIQQYPDLLEELKALQRSVLRIDKQVHFENKDALLKNVPVNPVNETNYEEYFVLYGDDELNSLEKDQVEQFVYKHPQYQVEFELILQAKLIPDSTITLPDKTYLYRTEEPGKVVAFRWWRLVAAAVVILFLSGVSLYLIRSHNGNPTGTNGDLTNANKVDTNSTTLAGTSKDQTDERKRNITVVPPQVNADSNKGIAQNKIEKRAGINNARKDNELKGITSNTSKNKVGVDSNKKDNRNVPPIDLADYAVGGRKLEPTELDAVNSTVEGKPVVSARPEINVSNLIAKAEPVVEPGIDPTGTDVGYNETDNKKNKMRGFLRKVTRVLDKATNAEPNEDGKSGVRIASFAVALK